MPEEKLLDVVLSGEKPFLPDGKHLNAVSSGEMRLLPDGSELNVSPYGEKGIWPYETANRKNSSASEPPHRARRSAF